MKKYIIPSFEINNRVPRSAFCTSVLSDNLIEEPNWGDEEGSEG